MVTPTTRHLPVLLAGLGLLAAASAEAQSAGDAARVATAITGGVSTGREVAGTVGAELTVRVVDGLAVFVEGGHLWDVVTDDLAARAQRIATAAGATRDVATHASVFDAGIRLRWAATTRVQPYGSAGAGAARVTTHTTFAVNGVTTAPDPLGIQLGRDLSGAVTKALFALGGGVVVPFGPRTFLDFGARYDRIFARPSVIPGDRAINAVRFQAGIGVRFGPS